MKKKKAKWQKLFPRNPELIRLQGRGKWNLGLHRRSPMVLDRDSFERPLSSLALSAEEETPGGTELRTNYTTSGWLAK
jgi:hypothetical protein